MLSELQCLLCESFLGNHHSQVGPKVLGFLCKRFNGVRPFLAAMVLALDHTEDWSSAELTSYYNVVLSLVSHPVNEEFIVSRGRARVHHLLDVDNDLFQTDTGSAFL